jgi:drug/metabolite transporter (DMT)-like permease
VQKIQQVHFAGQYKSEFMIVAMAICAVSLFFVAIFTEKKGILTSVTKGWIWFLLCGLANGGVNFGVMVLANQIPASVMFPTISAGATVLTCLVSWLFYKERLTKIQTAGLILGILAIVAMNL